MICNDMDGKWVHEKKQDRKDKLKRTYVTAIFGRIGSQIVSMQERKKYQTIFSHVIFLRTYNILIKEESSFINIIRPEDQFTKNKKLHNSTY
jgi:hypothetical protein